MNNPIVFLLLLIAAIGGYYHYSQPLVKKPERMTLEQQKLIAASTNPEDIKMYVTTECPYCHQANAWLKQNGFQFTECNLSVNDQCVREFNDYGADGTPFLVIRKNGHEHQMRDGFDSEELYSALSQ